MKILDCEQGSDEWLRCRMGVITASRAASLVTAKTKKPSSQAKTYGHELVGEVLTGLPADNGASGFAVDRGHEIEPQARAWFSLARAWFSLAREPVQEVGFCVSDDGRVGCSPDGLVGDDDGLEIKCPMPKKHVGNLLDPDRFAADHNPQVQFCLYVTGRKRWHLLSYCPDVVPVHLTVGRDEEYIAALDKACKALIADMDAAMEKIQALAADTSDDPAAIVFA